MNIFLRRSMTVLSGCILFANTLHATTYTTASAGNFSNSATWVGGNVPPALINTADTIIIGSGHNVLYNKNITIAHANAFLDVRGALASTAPQYMAMTAGNRFSISGTMDVDSMSIANATVTDITGQLLLRTLRCGDFIASGSGTVTIGEHLYLLGMLSNTAGCTILGSDLSTIHMMGGTLAPGGTGNKIEFGTTAYDVIYTDAAYNSPTGHELQMPALRHVTVDVHDTANVRLGNYTAIEKGTLTLKKGNLMLNNQNLEIKNAGSLASSGSGFLKSTSASNFTVNTTNAVAGTVRFAQGSAVGVFTCGSANGGTLKLATNLRVTGSVALQNAKVEVMDTCTLNLVTGATITGADAAGYIITTGSGAVAADIGSGQTFTYHIGTSANYAPCVVTSNNGTVYNGMKASVRPAVRTMGATGDDMSTKAPVVNGTWLLQDDDAAAVDVNVELAWTTAMEAGLFDRTGAYVTQFLTNYWDKIPGKPATAGPAGTHAVKRNGVKSLGYFAVFDNNTVDVKNIVTQKNISIYPNPATSVLHIDINDAARAAIYNVAGRLMTTTGVDANNNSIDIASLPAGMYYIQLTGENVNGTAKFIKQ